MAKELFKGWHEFCKHTRDENDELEECSGKEQPLFKEDTPSSRKHLTES